jgi:hypothetical protein
MSRFDNVFFYFRGPSTGVEGSQTRQVEDNTTKALVNVLHLAPDDLTSSLLRHVGVHLEAAWPWHHALQGGPEDGPFPARRLLVITARSTTDDPVWQSPAVDRGRIDAAIWAPGEALVAVEVKVSAALDMAQLTQHAKDWSIDKDAWVFATWADVHGWARQTLASSPRSLSKVSRFLLEQFADYLEIIGVAPFAGFRSEDFDFLAARRAALKMSKSGVPLDMAQVGITKSRLGELWDRVRSELRDVERMTLGAVRVGTLRASDDRMWAMTTTGDGGVNLTLELDADALELNLVAWTGRQVELFERWLKAPGATELLTRLEEFELVVWRKRAKQAASGKPFWMHTTQLEVGTLSLRSPAGLEDQVQALKEACEPGWESLGYHIRRAWPREVVEAAGELMTQPVTQAVRRLAPAVAAINWPPAGPLPAHTFANGPAATLEDLGVHLAPRSDPLPRSWRLLADGPAAMTLSNSGLHARGLRYAVGVVAGPGDDQAGWIAVRLQKTYADDGRTGYVEALYHGADLRRAVKAINRDLADAVSSGGSAGNAYQPSDNGPLEIAELARALAAGRAAVELSWEELDELARRGYRSGGSVVAAGWPAETPLVVEFRTRDS